MIWRELWRLTGCCMAVRGSAISCVSNNRFYCDYHYYHHYCYRHYYYYYHYCEYCLFCYYYRCTEFKTRSVHNQHKAIIPMSSAISYDTLLKIVHLVFDHVEETQVEIWSTQGLITIRCIHLTRGRKRYNKKKNKQREEKEKEREEKEKEREEKEKVRKEKEKERKEKEKERKKERKKDENSRGKHKRRNSLEQVEKHEEYI